MHRKHMLRRGRVPFGIVLPLVLSLLLASPAAGQNAEDSVRKHFAFSDLQRLQSATSTAISPDGAYVAYTVAGVVVSADRIVETLWVLNLANQQARPLQLEEASGPAWSQSGSELATVQTDAAGQCSVAIRRTDSFEKLRSFLTPCSPSHLTWSHDGKYLAFTLFTADDKKSSFLEDSVASAEATLARPADAHWAAPVELTQLARYRQDGGQWLKAGHQHIFVLSTETGEMKQIGTEPFNDVGPAWMPDGKHLLFTSDRRSDSDRTLLQPEIYTTDLAGHVDRLTRNQGRCYGPIVSPDGSRIAFTAIPDRKVNYTRSDLYIMHTDGTGLQRLGAELDRDIYSPVWSADSRSLFARYNDHGIGHLERFHLDGSRERILSGLGSGFSVATSGSIAYLAKSATAPDDLAVLQHGHTYTTLTGLNSFLRGRELGQLQHLVAHSSVDQREVEAWFLLPPGAPPHGRWPTIFAMHGGPFGDDGPYWSSTYQLLAAAGYAVVYVNYRGSTSYGSSFSEPANTDFPGLASNDMMSVVDEAIEEGVTAPERMFLYGGSAGGQLVVWITGKTTRFKAAVAEKPVINAVSEALVSDQYLGAPDTAGGDPWVREQALWRQSPLSLAGAITTPTLLIVGERDYRTPLDQTLQLYGALQLKGVPTALMRVPDAGHESLGSRPSQRVAEIAAELAWFGWHGSSDRP